MAEREGFEPSRRFPAYTLSRRAPSTTRPPLQQAGHNHFPVACASAGGAGKRFRLGRAPAGGDPLSRADQGSRSRADRHTARSSWRRRGPASWAGRHRGERAAAQCWREGQGRGLGAIGARAFTPSPPRFRRGGTGPLRRAIGGPARGSPHGPRSPRSRRRNSAPGRPPTPRRPCSSCGSCRSNARSSAARRSSAGSGTAPATCA